MDAEKEVKKLIKNINVGIKKLTLEKFNQVISNAITKYSSKGEFEINESVKIVCKYYSVSVETLMTKTRGDVYLAKIVLFKILNHSLNISAQRIAKFFKRYPNSVTHALKKFDKLNPDKRNKDKKLLADYNELNTKIKLLLINENE